MLWMVKKPNLVIDSAVYKKCTTCWFQDYGAIIVKLEQGLMPLSIWKSSMETLTQILKTSRININNAYDSVDILEIAQKPISQYNHLVDKVIKVNGSLVQNST